jgi:hypothetical protein
MTSKPRWYAWVVQYDAGWGLVGAMIPGLGQWAPLIFRRREHAEKLGSLAVAHGKAAGRPVRLIVLEEVEELERVE